MTPGSHGSRGLGRAFRLFLVASFPFAAVVIAWGTVFVHAWRVANAKPVHALRHE
jgi:hypothetical protein